MDRDSLDREYDAATKPFRRALVVLLLVATIGFTGVVLEAGQPGDTPWWRWVAIAAAIVTLLGVGGFTLCASLLWRYRKPKGGK